MIFFVLITSCITRLFTLYAPQALWWDGAIYVDMGKFMYSDGAIGYWEQFRPVVWPFILGFFWKIGLDPYTVGIWIQIAASLAAIYVIYKIGEKLYPKSGIYAALLLAFTPVFIEFTVIPLTDIPSMMLSLVAIYLFLTKKYIRSGILFGFAFLFRFPHALAALPVLILATLALIKDKNWQPIKKLAIGGLPIVIAFFVLNIFLYSDPLLPIKAGNTMIAQSVGPFDLIPFFYVRSFFEENAFLIFGLTFLYAWIRKPKELFKNQTAFIVLVNALVIGLYFSNLHHKELRYGLAFFPYVVLAAGFGIAWLVDKIKEPIARPTAIIAFTITMLILGYTTVVSMFNWAPENPERQAYLDLFKQTPYAKIMTSSPQIPVKADVKLERVADRWEDFYDRYRNANIRFDYVAIDSCEMYCRGALCEQSRKALFETLEKENSLIFSKTVGSCTLWIYKNSEVIQ
jgi:4-amino-4-deoxy-L-arabinose transferase-like glycosyltransferase